MLTCREVTERASEYLDGNLSLKRRLTLRFHLMMCRHCRRYVDQLAQTIALVRAAGRAPPDRETVERVVAELERTYLAARASE